MNTAWVMALVILIGITLCVLGFILYLNSRREKPLDHLPDIALQPRVNLDVRSAFYVNRVPDADIEFDGLHIHITLPQEYERKAQVRARIEHMAAQVFRKGIPRLYLFDDRVLDNGLVLRDTRRKKVA